MDPNQSTNIFSRQYIEEWFRYSTRNVLKLNYDQTNDASKSAGTPVQQYAGVDPQQIYHSTAVGSAGTVEQDVRIWNECKQIKL